MADRRAAQWIANAVRAMELRSEFEHWPEFGAGVGGSDYDEPGAYETIGPWQYQKIFRTMP